MAEKANELENKLEELKEEYSKTKANKATNKHLGILRRKIAETKKGIIEAHKHVKGAGYFVKKTGDATVALLGFPSAGKSSMINALTNTKSKTAQYAFTTTEIVPGTMVYNDAHIQIFDMPGLIEGAHLGLGGARSVISGMKVADLIVFVIDLNSPHQLELLLNELKSLDIHVNEKRPRVQINETTMNIGLVIEENRSKISNKDVVTILSGFGLRNARIRIDENIGEDDFIAFVSGKSRFMRALIVLNKIDLRNDYEKIAKEIAQKTKSEVIPISATENINLERLKSEIYRNLDIMTTYLRPKAGDERLTPLVLKNGSTVGDAARKLHTEIVDELKCAYITGPSAKFDKQSVGMAHVLKNGDIITFIRAK